MGLLRYGFFCFLLLTFTLGCAQNNIIIREKENPASVASTSRVRQIIAEKKKKKFEFVEIDGKKYKVPQPWLGRKINQAPPPLSDLQQIPVAFTHNQAKISVEKDACAAFVRMAEKALEENIHLLVHSGFRSVQYQRKIFSKLMNQGRVWQDLVRYIAPPGYSEHMLGRAVDFYPSNWQFAATNEYQWLLENGARFGFTQTYPEVNVAGYPWESWHWNFTDISN